MTFKEVLNQTIQQRQETEQQRIEREAKEYYHEKSLQSMSYVWGRDFILDT
jgi:hypothetical protein